LESWQSQPLDGVDPVGLILDGVHVGEHCLIAALGVAADDHQRGRESDQPHSSREAQCKAVAGNQTMVP
jgi:hypothetical protein